MLIKFGKTVCLVSATHCLKQMQYCSYHNDSSPLRSFFFCISHKFFTQYSVFQPEKGNPLALDNTTQYVSYPHSTMTFKWPRRSTNQSPFRPFVQSTFLMNSSNAAILCWYIPIYVHIIEKKHKTSQITSLQGY